MKRAVRIAVGVLFGLIAAGVALPDASSAAAPTHQARKGHKAPAAKPAETAPKPVSAVRVTVTNSRPASLVELRAGVSGSGKMSKVLGSLRPGKEAVARLPRGEGCQVDLHGAFDDGQTLDSTGVDVCADKTVNLTD